MRHDQNRRIRLSRHAREKFETLKRYGFEISEEEVIFKILSAWTREAHQYLAIRAIDEEHALRVVTRKKNHLLVITFYPVRRKRYGV